jgi:hypothetical protein
MWKYGVHTEVFVRIIERLAEALTPVQATRQCILLLDCMGAHYAPPVLRAAHDRAIWLAFVPASLTWLLQVLDTHGFAQFKERLRELISLARMGTPSGVVPMPEWIGIICTTIREVFEGRDWTSAFLENGFCLCLDCVRPRIWAHIGEHVCAVSTDRPSAHQLGLVFPSNRSAPCSADLFPPLGPPPVRVRRRIVIRGLG